MSEKLIGHNSRTGTVTVEARLFNSVGKFAGPDGPCRKISLPAGSTIGDLLGALSVPAREVFLVLKNGRDVTKSLYTGINTSAVIDDGDVIAFSGPVPYSWGYGAPVV